MNKDDLAKMLVAGMPDERQLALINSYRPAGTKMYEAADIFQFPMVVSDNLTHHDGFVWSASVLESMGRSLMGKPLLLDHAWNDSENVCGILFDCLLVEMPLLNSQLMSDLLAMGCNKEGDSMVLNSEGYKCLLAWAAMSATDDMTKDVLSLRKSGISVGGFVKNQGFLCPVCKDAFFSKRCKHYLSSGNNDGMIDDGMDSVPYIVRTGVFWGIEASMVIPPNCPRAKIISDSDLNRLQLK